MMTAEIIAYNYNKQKSRMLNLFTLNTSSLTLFGPLQKRDVRYANQFSTGSGTDFSAFPAIEQLCELGRPFHRPSAKPHSASLRRRDSLRLPLVDELSFCLRDVR